MRDERRITKPIRPLGGGIMEADYQIPLLERQSTRTIEHGNAILLLHAEVKKLLIHNHLRINREFNNIGKEWNRRTEIIVVH